MTDPLLLSAEEAARLLGYDDPSTLHRIRKLQPAFPPQVRLYPRGAPKYRRADLERLVESLDENGVAGQ